MSDEAKATAYDAVGGADGVRRLVRRFYALMDELPEAYALRKMHPEDLQGSEDNLFDYLSGWFGGPPLYEQKKGHPRLRMRHPFKVGAREVDEWMLCMRGALDAEVANADLREALYGAFAGLANHMVNT